MKFIKSLILLAAAVPFFASCEDDDVNSAQCTLGFASSTVEISEASSGYLQIPINVTGKRNGPIHVTIEATPAGQNGAVEGENYIITDKTLNLNADTLSTGTINVEVKIINDNEINDDRSFNLTIASVEGAEVSTQTTQVTIIDDDKDPYFNFFGTWYFNATGSDANGQPAPIAALVTVDGATSMSDAAYGRRLTFTSTEILTGAEVVWTMNYSLDAATNTGTLAFPCGDNLGQVQTYDPVTGTEVVTVDLRWALVSPTGEFQPTATWTSDEWQLQPDGIRPPTEIKFPTDGTQLLLGFSYQGGFYSFNGYTDVTFTKAE